MGLGVGVGGEGEWPLPRQLPAPVIQKSRKESLLQRLRPAGPLRQAQAAPHPLPILQPAAGTQSP